LRLSEEGRIAADPRVYVNFAVTMPAAFIVAVVEAEVMLAIVMLAVLDVHVEPTFQLSQFLHLFGGRKNITPTGSL
jgi:hypothetical protein